MRRLLLFLCLLIGLPACSATVPTGNRVPVTIAMGYIPDVQFAPFYVAQAKGYYAAEGLDVQMDHSSVRDALIQVAQGQLTFANASGDEILLARSQEIPIKSVFQTYQRFPVALFAKASTGIRQPADLRGKVVGVPGRFGATYIGLQALLYAAQVPEQEVQIAEIGFTQAQAVRQDKVDAAMGYANNEPLLLQADGIPVNVVPVADYLPLVSNGIVTSDRLAADNPDLVRRFVRATARGLQDTLDDPDEAFELALDFIPELEPARRPQELRKLKETLALWRPTNTTGESGYSDPEQWQITYRFLRESGILSSDVDVQQAYTNDLRK
jgi:NitT/TauT family transport system substrate-binding protein